MFYKSIFLTIAAMGLVSCESMGNFNKVSSNQVGVSQQVVPATVVSAEAVTIDSESSTRQLGTGVGAAVGLGAGQLLGKGKGRVASTVGFAAAGALAGRYLADSVGRTKAQRLTVSVDGTGATYSFIQPVYKQIGEISPGTHGSYHHGSNAHFVPDGRSLVF